jgi:hypothetical protein
VIEGADEAVMFPHVVSNEKDPLYALSDSSGHSACVNANPLGLAMLAVADEYYKKAGPGKRTCVACGEQVLNPDDYLVIGYLGNPSTSQLGNFNYTHLHKSHIRDWKQADAFLTLARVAVGSGEWQGDALTNIIREIEAPTLAIATASSQSQRR